VLEVPPAQEDVVPERQPPAEGPPPARPWYRRWWLLLGVVVLGTLLFGRLAGGDARPAGPAATVPPGGSAAPNPKSRQVVPEQALRDAIGGRLGASNRGVERLPELDAMKDEYIVLRWTINQRPTRKLAGDGARRDVLAILRAVKGVPEHDRYSGVVLSGSYPLVDGTGNARETVVVRATYDTATLDRTDLRGVELGEVLELADAGTVDPAFR
jgi:hypothetical protein